MDCRERGSHAWGVYPTQDNPGMGTARVNKEEEADIRIIVIEYSVKYGNKECGHEGEKYQTRPK